jgi:hypothetical protein
LRPALSLISVLFGTSCPDNYIAQKKKDVVSAPNRKPWINQQELLTTDSLQVVNKKNPSDGSWYWYIR